jgi:putative spermidine/putrescine transport system ATP-binding protein
MSDRVAVFHDGGLVQIGTPDALYNEPADAFVAGFIGENNTLNGVVEQMSGGECRISFGGGLYVTARAVGIEHQGQHAAVAVRPERIRLASSGPQNDNCLRATVGGRIYLGDHERLLSNLENGQALTVKVGPKLVTATGESVMVTWASADGRAFPSEMTSGNGESKGEI